MWSCNFHPCVAKMVGYTLEPDFFIVTKLYELDLFRLVHTPEELLAPILALKLAGYFSTPFSSSSFVTLFAEFSFLFSCN